MYHDPWRKFINRAFSKIPAFANNKDVLNDEICYSMKTERYNPRELIFRPGDLADRIMIVTDGRVRITFNLADSTLHSGISKAKYDSYNTGFGLEIKDTLIPRGSPDNKKSKKALSKAKNLSLL